MGLLPGVGIGGRGRRGHVATRSTAHMPHSFAHRSTGRLALRCIDDSIFVSVDHVETPRRLGAEFLTINHAVTIEVELREPSRCHSINRLGRSATRHRTHSTALTHFLGSKLTVFIDVHSVKAPVGFS